MRSLVAQPTAWADAPCGEQGRGVSAWANAPWESSGAAYLPVRTRHWRAAVLGARDVAGGVLRGVVGDAVGLPTREGVEAVRGDGVMRTSTSRYAAAGRAARRGSHWFCLTRSATGPWLASLSSAAPSCRKQTLSWCDASEQGCGASPGASAAGGRDRPEQCCRAAAAAGPYAGATAGGAGQRRAVAGGVVLVAAVARARWRVPDAVRDVDAR
jgi:hypothetical protein